MLGDDNLFACNTLIDKDLLIESYKELGLDVKVHIHETPYDAKFL